eukprot:jgi/Mesen1/2447/ME000158S01640
MVESEDEAAAAAASSSMDLDSKCAGRGRGPLGKGLGLEEEQVLEARVRAAVGSVPLLVNGTIMRYQLVVGLQWVRQEAQKALTDQLSSYLHLVGPELGTRLAYSFL